MDTALIVDVNIVPITGDNVDKLIKSYPFYAKQMVPAGTYKGNDGEVPTVSVMAMLGARADLEEEIVYKIINAVYSDLEQLKKAHDKFKDIEMKKGLIGMGIPLHPGAEKYFAEKGVK
jgi:TRAP transporter TAXI family solute receptor